MKMKIELNKVYKIKLPDKPTRLATCITLIPAHQKPSEETVNLYYGNPPELAFKQFHRAINLHRWIFLFHESKSYCVFPDHIRMSKYVMEVE